MKTLEHSSRRFLTIAAVAALIAASAMFAGSRPSVASSGTTPLGMVIPLYTYPTDGTWTQVAQAKQANPSVPIIAVINPDSGPGSSQDPNYVSGIQQLQSAGVAVYGYVDTAYGSDSVSSVEANVNLYSSWYHVNGILFDDMNNLAAYASYYSTLGSYVSAHGMRSMGNPGTSVDLSLIGTLNALCVYESTGLPAISFITYPGYSASNFAVVALGVSLDTTFLSDVQGIVAWVYLTNYSGSNPYDVLPSYFSSEMSALASLDGTGTSTTSSTSTASTSSTTTTTTSTTGSSATITVDSVDLSGNPISGLWTTVDQGSANLQSGYTPMVFTGTAGQTYTVTVSNYQNFVFCHWGDGTTGSSRTVTLTVSTTLNAVYSTNGSCATQVQVTVRSLTKSGALFTGMWLQVSSGGEVVASGYTTLTFTATVGAQYTVSMSNYQNYVFSHWGSGSTNPSYTFTATKSVTLSAYYRK